MNPSRENVQPHHGNSFAIRDIELAAFEHDYHYHPEIELTWIVESEGERQVGDCVETFQSGDLVLIGESLPHKYRNWAKGRARSKVVQFKRDLFGPDFFKLREFAEIEQLLNDSSRGLTFSKETTAMVQRQLRKLFRSGPGALQVLQLIEVLHTLSLDNTRHSLASIVYAEPIQLKKIDRLKRILNFLDTHWQDTITLDEVAKITALHPQSVSRFFKHHLGMNFQDYLLRLRLGRAAHSLLETNRTVTDIAFNSGFSNLAHFNRQFKVIYQQTPSEYRSR